MKILRFRLLRLMDGIGIKSKVWGEILSSNGLLRSNVGDLSMMKIQEIVINIACSLWVEYTECKKVS